MGKETFYFSHFILYLRNYRCCWYKNIVIGKVLKNGQYGWVLGGQKCTSLWKFFGYQKVWVVEQADLVPNITNQTRLFAKKRRTGADFLG